MNLKQDMHKELQKMDDEVVRVRIECEEEFKQRSVQIQEEEYKKYVSSVRAAEGKLQASEEAREAMVQKNQ